MKIIALACLEMYVPSFKHQTRLDLHVLKLYSVVSKTVSLMGSFPVLSSFFRIKGLVYIN